MQSSILGLLGISSVPFFLTRQVTVSLDWFFCLARPSLFCLIQQRYNTYHPPSERVILMRSTDHSSILHVIMADDTAGFLHRVMGSIWLLAISSTSTCTKIELS